MKGYCLGCEKDNIELVRHHWYDDKSRRSGHWVYVCRCCNGKLTSEDGKDNHVLPEWAIQKAKVMGRDTSVRAPTAEEWRLERQLREEKGENLRLREELGRCRGQCAFLREQVERSTVINGAVVLGPPPGR